MLKKNGQKILIFLLAAIMIFSIAGCGQQDNQDSQDKLAKIQESGKIVLGTSADYPPYEFHKEIDGKDQIVGFDIEIAKAIADDLGVELEIKDMKFEGLLAALAGDKIDFIVSGMTPTPERAESVDFSKEYYVEEQKLLIRKADADKIKTVDDIKGLKIGAQKATVQEEIATGIEGAADVKLLAKITDLVLELSNDKIDAIVLPKPVAIAYAESNPNLFAPEISFGRQDGVAIAVAKGNPELAEAINQTLDRLIEEGKIDEFIAEATKLAEE